MMIYDHMIARRFPSGATGPAGLRVLDDAGAAGLASKVVVADKRRTAAHERYQIWCEDYSHLIARRIASTHNEPSAIDQIKRFVSVAFNPAKDIVPQLAVVYRHGARRLFLGNEQGTAALEEVVKESGFPLLAQELNQLAFFLGPCTVVPVVREGRLTWDTLLPHTYEILRDPRNPSGDPIAAAWTIGEAEDLGGAVDAVVLDADSWRYYEVRNGRTQLVDTVPHGLGMFPGAVLRFDMPMGPDWWNRGHGQRLVDGTIDVGVIASVMGFVRKAQNKRLLVLSGTLDRIGGGQTLDPEVPLTINYSPGTVAELSSIDLDTPPDSFFKHIRFIVETLIESYGIPASAVTFDGGAGTESERINMTHEGLTEIRNRQIEHCRQWEHDLWYRACRMMRAFGHPLASRLPSDAEVAETFRVDFPKLARSFADPNQEREYLDWQIRHGVIAPLDLLAREFPTMTTEQLVALQEQNLNDYARLNDWITSRNLRINPQSGAVEGAGVITGRQGGQATPSSDEQDLTNE